MNRSITACVIFLVLAIASPAFALDPSRTYKQRPEKYNMQYKQVKIRIDRDTEINAWHFPATNSQHRLVVISHSGDGNMADYLRRVDQFTSKGWSVLIYDYRGYGESSEFEIDNGMYIYPHFLEDLRSVLEHAASKVKPAKTVLYGWGIGAGLSLGVGWHRKEISRIIADTPFLSMADTEERFSSWKKPLEVPFAGYDKIYEPLHAVAKAPGFAELGVLLIIGSNDALFKPEDMETLQALNAKHFFKTNYVVENPDRNDNFKVNKAGYFKVIGDFLGK